MIDAALACQGAAPPEILPETGCSDSSQTRFHLGQRASKSNDPDVSMTCGRTDRLVQPMQNDSNQVEDPYAPATNDGSQCLEMFLETLSGLPATSQTARNDSNATGTALDSLLIQLPMGATGKPAFISGGKRLVAPAKNRALPKNAALQSHPSSSSCPALLISATGREQVR